jgi:hypothetical protein
MSASSQFAAGLISALIGAGVSSLGSSKGHGGSGRGGRRKGGGSKRVASSGLGGMYPTNAADLNIRPPSYTNVPRSIPRNVGRMVTWDIFKTDVQIVSGSAGIVETNFSFVITQNPQYGSWLTLFDQYCIPQVSIEFDSLTPPGQTYSSPVLYTALDFDNASTITNISAIEEYDSCEFMVMAPEKRHLRSVRPSTKGAVLTSGTSTTAAVSGPVWCDSGNNNVTHYGIRSLVQFYNAGSIKATITMYNAYRNHI